MTRRQIAVVLSGFPRRSETFALAEVAALDEQGLLAAVFSTKPGETGVAQPNARRLAPRVRRLAGEPAAQAAEAARILAAVPLAGVHAYFAHTPAAIAAATAASLGVPFGFSVHARDARKVSRGELHARARAAACVIACNTDVLREFDGSGAQVRLVPHGVDLDRFDAAPVPPAPILRLLAVGRLVEKKGFHILLEALSHVHLPWRLRIVGEGPEAQRLSVQARTLGLSDRVWFAGALTHDVLPQEYAAAEVVLMPSVSDRSGDRDGLPNVVLEAMASGRAIIASDMGAIGSAITHGATGVLVPAGDARVLADAVNQLGRNPRRRAALGAAAREAAERTFDVRACTNRLASVFREAYA